MKLRPYQEQAIEACRRAFATHRSALLTLPTGAGKTVIFSSLTGRAITKGRVLVMAHRQELVYQAAEKIRAETGIEPAIEMASQHADADFFHTSPIVVSTVQTLSRGRHKKFDPKEFVLGVVDEAHHAPSPSYRKVMRWFAEGNPAFVWLGVTATPDRADEKAMGQVFESAPFTYQINDAIDDGYLVPVRQTQVQVKGLDFSKVKTTAGDFNQRELAEIIEQESVLHEVARPVVDLSGDRRTVVFCVRVHQAEMLAAIINRYKPGTAAMVHGAMDKDIRADLLKRYAQGEFQYMCNVGVLTEGWDDPGVQLVVMARPTKSRALYAQCVGRGTRPLPGLVDHHDTAEERRAAIAASDKPYCEVIDFGGNAGKHRLIGLADILGGKYDDEVVEAVRARQESGAVAADVAKDLEDEAERQKKLLEKQAIDQFYAARRGHIRAEVDYQTRSVHPFKLHSASSLGSVSAGMNPATAKQVTTLERMGVKNAVTMGRAEAHELLGKLIKRRQRGLCTYKQAQVLRRYGYDPELMTFDQAKRTIDALAANNWKRVPA